MKNLTFFTAFFVTLLSNNVLATSTCPGLTDVGMNLTGFTYYSSALPFKNIALQNNNGFQAKKASATSTVVCTNNKDADGYPIKIDSGCLSEIIIAKSISSYSTNLPYKAGKYAVTFDGQGTIKFIGDATGTYIATQTTNNQFEITISPTFSRGLTLDIISTDPNNTGNYIKNLAITSKAKYANGIDSDDTTYKSQPFNEDYLNVLAPFNPLRFMDVRKTNDTRLDYVAVAESTTANTITLPASGMTQGIFSDATIPASIPSADWVTAMNVNNDDVLALIHYTNPDGTNEWDSALVDSFDPSTRTLTLYLNSPLLAAPHTNKPEILIKSFYNKLWQDRTPPTSINQATKNGLAWEHIVNMANLTNKDLWLNIPTGAKNTYIESLANYLRSSLNPNLKVYIEYSNEVWNGSFDQAKYATQKARLAGLSGWYDWYAAQSINIFKIFNAVYGESDLSVNRVNTNSKLVRVLSSQTTVPSKISSVVNSYGTALPSDINSHKAYEYADALAVANYLQDDYIDTKNLTLTTDQVITGLRNYVDAAYNKTSGWLPADAKIAKARNLLLVAYEGGQHLIPGNDARLLNLYRSAFNTAGAQNLYSYHRSMWSSLKTLVSVPNTPELKIGAMNQFNDIQAPNQYGLWGILESVYQPLSSSPRYLGLTTCPVQ